MNRGSFLKTLLGGFGAAIIAPKVLAKVKPEPAKFTNSFEDFKTVKFHTNQIVVSGVWYPPPTEEYKYKI